jgi:3',5'-cyclic AMP phosphodiesterase CpdA
MTRLLHLSDLHFGTEQPHLVAEVLALAHQLRPDAVVISGGGGCRWRWTAKS